MLTLADDTVSYRYRLSTSQVCVFLSYFQDTCDERLDYLSSYMTSGSTLMLPFSRLARELA